MTPQDAMTELRRVAGRQLDGELVESFIAMLEREGSLTFVPRRRRRLRGRARLRAARATDRRVQPLAERLDVARTARRSDAARTGVDKTKGAAPMSRRDALNVRSRLRPH